MDPPSTKHLHHSSCEVVRENNKRTDTTHCVLHPRCETVRVCVNRLLFKGKTYTDQQTFQTSRVPTMKRAPRTPRSHNNAMGNQLQGIKTRLVSARRNLHTLQTRVSLSLTTPPTLVERMSRRFLNAIGRAFLHARSCPRPLLLIFRVATLSPCFLSALFHTLDASFSHGCRKNVDLTLLSNLRSHVQF